MLAIRLPTSALGQSTGVAPVDNFLASPFGKVAAAGAIGVTAAKVFPGKTVMPFVASALLAILFGLVPDVRTAVR